MQSISENYQNCEFEAKLTPEDFTDELRKFVNDYKCTLCKGVYYNPYVDKCGHVFCRECILKYLQYYHQCPISKQEMATENLNKLVFIADILEKQSVRCKNRDNGCDWMGKLIELEPHMNNDCKRQIISCPNVGCSAKVFREEREGHIDICDFRIVSCEFCEIQIAFIDMKKHYEICPKFIMDCLQHCGKRIERKEMDLHIDESCFNTIINCPFAGVGCEFVCSKKDLAKHFFKKNSEHMLYMFAYLVKSQRNFNSVKENIINVLTEFQVKNNANEQSNHNFNSSFFSDHLNLIGDLKQNLIKLEENDVKDHSDIFSFLKIGFFFNKKNPNQKHIDSEDVLELGEYSISKQEIECVKDNIKSLEYDEKISCSDIIEDRVAKTDCNPITILGNIPGNNPSILNLNEINSNQIEKSDKDSCSKLLGLKRRKINEEVKSNENVKEIIQENNENNVIQINTFMEIQN